jgi:adenylate cyclase
MEEKPKILVVDDEKDNVDLLFRLFRKDYVVLKAFSGDQGLEAVKNEKDNIACIIADMKMPGMNGAVFLAKTIEYSPNTTRIILSGYSDSDDLLASINEAKVYLYLIKPFEHEKLKKHVEIGVEFYRQKMLFEKGLKDVKSISNIKSTENFSFNNLEIMLETNDEKFAKKLSLDRIFLNTDELLPIGSVVTLKINFDHNKEFTKISGVVFSQRLENPRGIEIKLNQEH